MDTTKRVVEMKTGKRDMFKASNNYYYYNLAWIGSFSEICFGLIKRLIISMDYFFNSPKKKNNVTPFWCMNSITIRLEGMGPIAKGESYHTLKHIRC